MLLLVVRKMLNNKWMIACLLIGSIIAVAMVSSIPMYTDGVVHRMLIRDLEEFQNTTLYYPGRVNITGNLYRQYDKNPNARLDAYKSIDSMLVDQLVPALGVPTTAFRRQFALDYLVCWREAELLSGEDIPGEYILLNGVWDYQDHVKVLYGKLPSGQVEDGVYEAAVTESAQKEKNFALNETYVFKDNVHRNNGEYRVKIVGIIAQDDLQDPFWGNDGLVAYDECMFADPTLLWADLTDIDQSLITNCEWDIALDYHSLTIENLPDVVKLLKDQEIYFKRNFSQFNVKIPALDIFETCLDRADQLRTMLWVLQVPILLMLAFYIFMVSQLIIEYERNEIAVMKSRGAAAGQILYSYFLQSLLVTLAALVIGPFLGKFLCDILGASNGFLEFVQRTALVIKLDSEVLLYALGAAVFSVLTMLLPAVAASRATIVEHKTKRARRTHRVFWKKFFLDFILLGVSLYGLYSYEQRQKTLMVTGVNAADIPIDPLLFIISTLFIIGAGLVVLRLYPYLVRFIFWIGRRFWSPALYASFIQVGRSGGREQFLMVFLILTLAIGVFSANSARTINVNVEEKISYQAGTDMVLTNRWQSKSNDDGDIIGYTEPKIQPYLDMPGVENMTKVMVLKSKYSNIRGKSDSSVTCNFMGIIPDEFGKVAWLRADMLGAHWYYYLNLLADSPTACLVSRAYADVYGIEPGDDITLTVNNQLPLSMIVYAVIDYWPTFNPEIKADRFFIIGNLNYYQSKLITEPYQLWIARDEETTSEEMYEYIENNNLPVLEIKDARQLLIKAKNDPLLQGTNGALSMGFVVTMAISAIGFIIYWILSIKSRVLQFGIFRAMGMSMRNIVAMLFSEQILISFISILIGVIVGGVTSDLYVPLLQVVYSAQQQIPPFRVVADASDYLKIYIIVGIMLVTGFSILGMLISRIKMSQAIKLGEE